MNMPLKEKWIHIGIWVTLFIAWIMMIYFAWLMWCPCKIVDVTQPYKVLNEDNQVARGELLMLEFEYNKYKDVPSDVVRSIQCEDGNLVTLTPVRSNLPMGYNTFRADVEIPEKTSLGICKYVVDQTFHINHFRDQEMHYESEPFEVIE